MEQDGGIIVYVATRAKSRQVGSILSFHLQPTAEPSEDGFDGCFVKFHREFGQVISVRAKTLADAESLIETYGQMSIRGV